MNRTTSSSRSTRALSIALWLAVWSFSVAAEGGREVEGRALDAEGRPVPGAVVVLDAEGTPTLRTETDQEGGFHFENGLGEELFLRINKDGFAPYVRRMGPSSRSSGLEVRLEVAAVQGEILVTAAMPDLAGASDYPGRQLLESGAADVAGFFRGVGGASAIRRGAINLETTIRGLQEEQVATFVDGTRTFAAGPARMDSNLSHVSPHAVENIRVVKGPYALAWGGGTLSAVDVETFRPDFTSREGALELDGSLASSYVENGEAHDTGAAVWGSGEHLRFYLSAGHREGDDFTAGSGATVPGGYESSESRWRLGFRPHEGLSIDYSGGYQEQSDLDYPGRLLDATYFYARSHALELLWDGEAQGHSFSELYAQVYSNHKDHLMNNDAKPTARPAPGRVPPFALRVDLPTESETQGGRLRTRFERDRLAWTFGADVYQLDQTARRFVSRRDNGVLLFEDSVWPDARIRDLGGYGQLVYRGEGLRVGAALRVDDVDTDASDLSPFFLANTSGSAEQGETHVSAALNASWDVGGWSWTAGVGRSVRTATVLERYSDRFPATKFQLSAEFMGDPELEPEVSHELNLGARSTWGSFFFEADVFVRVIDNYITIVADPTLPRRLPLSPETVYRYVNGSEARFRGGELLLTQRLNERLSWRANLAYIWAEDASLGEPVLGIAPLGGELGVRWRLSNARLWFDLKGRFADRQSRVAVSRFERETPSYAVYDLASEWEATPRVTFKAAVENLFDRAYSHHLNAPNPFSGQRIEEIGRSARLGVHLKL